VAPPFDSSICQLGVFKAETSKSRGQLLELYIAPRRASHHRNKLAHWYISLIQPLIDIHIPLEASVAIASLVLYVAFPVGRPSCPMSAFLTRFIVFTE
jgi:hypothetical protein